MQGRRRPVKGPLRRLVYLRSLCRMMPVSDHYGSDRGTAIDRHYIDGFLYEHRADIQGACLEVRDKRYTERFGSRVATVDIVDLDATNRDATIHADLTDAAEIPSSRFDCFILTQTLQYVYNLRAAVAEAHRILRPNGVLLMTVPSVSRIDAAAGVGGDFWRFTVASTRKILAEAFGEGRVEAKAYGNVLTATAFLLGLAAEELSRKELEYQDERFPLLIAARAVKRGPV